MSRGKATGTTSATSSLSCPVAAVLVLIPLGLFTLGGGGDPDLQVSGGTVALVFGFIIVLLLSGFYGYGRLYAVRDVRVQRRNRGLMAMSTRFGSLRRGHSSRVTGESVGKVPLFASEDDQVVECDLYGTYRGHRLALLRCGYVVDAERDVSLATSVVSLILTAGIACLGLWLASISLGGRRICRG